jgi:sulfur relay (sulfurtransferase) complex TusBCD TusD component (DsrE family)
MSKKVAVVITENPHKTPRPVEALRIALGLCAGDHETTVVLLGESPILLTDEIDDVEDVDILEKYRPSLAQLQVPFVVPEGAIIRSPRKDFSVRRASSLEIRHLIQSAERALVF